tara:strand:- start:384 stop:692 length:309 start_codon:yes stop_codon:yes gene_type:complete
MAIVKKLTESRDKTCAVRFAESEFSELKKASEMTGVSMSSIMRQGTKSRIDQIKLEALKKEAKLKELESEVMSKITCLDKVQKQEMLAIFHGNSFLESSIQN